MKNGTFPFQFIEFCLKKKMQFFDTRFVLSKLWEKVFVAFFIFKFFVIFRFFGRSDSSVRNFVTFVQKSVEKWFVKVDHFEPNFSTQCAKPGGCPPVSSTGSSVDGSWKRTFDLARDNDQHRRVANQRRILRSQWRLRLKGEPRHHRGMEEEKIISV